MSDDWWSTPAGVQCVLREEIKIRDTRIDEVLNQLDSARHSVEALEARLKKTVAFVYPDTSYGKRVCCNFTVLHKSPLEVMAVFQEQFQMVNDRLDSPVAVALFIGDDIVTSVCLKELGLYAALYQGDTITVSP